MSLVPPETPEIVTGNHYNKYHGKNVLIRTLTNRFLSRFDRMLDAVIAEGPKPTRILEVGTGDGHIAARVRERFPSATVVAIDLPDAELRRAWRDRDGVTFFHADAHQLPFNDNAFDLVVACESLEHLTDPWTGIAEIARVSAHHLVLSVPNEPLFRLGNFLTGRHVADFGNTPGHLNHWGTAGFIRFVSVHAAIANVATPLPWTILRARSDA